MADINLLPTQERAAARVGLMRRRLQMASVGALLIAAVLAIITLVFFLYYARQNSLLVAKIEQDSARVNRLKTQEELLVVVKDKVSIASSLLLVRENYPNFFAQLSGLVPQDLYFTDMTVTEGKVVISGKARTSSDVAGFANSLISAEGAEIVSNVAMDSLSSDDAGVYTFVISGQLTSATTQ